MNVDDSEYLKGIRDGEFRAQLAMHERMIAAINDNLSRIASDMQAMNLTVQRLSDQAAANTATNQAIRDSEQQRIATAERRWSPFTRFAVAMGALSAIATVIAFILGRK